MPVSEERIDQSLMAEERQESNESPEVLCQRVREGDASAFSELVRPWQKEVFRLAFSILRNREDALDVVQETLMRVYENLDSYLPGHNFGAWVLRIARNLSLDHYRHYRGQKRSKKDEVPLSLVESSVASPSEDQRKKVMKQLLEEAAAALPEKQRLVFILRHFQGFTHEEIADVLDVAVGTVKSLHFKALARIKILIGRRLRGMES